MNNQGLVKWIVLSALLIVTFILVWQAPELEETEVVEPVDLTNQRSVPKRTAAPIQRSTVDIELKARDFNQQTVDLFAVPSRPKPVRPKITQPIPKAPTVKRVELPFRYVGKLEEPQKVIYFLMEGTSLYLAQPGDVINEQFRLQKVDTDSNEIEWLHLPTNETRKMSTEQ